MKQIALYYSPLIFISLILSACSLSKAEIQEGLPPQLPAQTPSSTNTLKAIDTPTITSTPTVTKTPTPKPSITPTPTPLPGSFSNPARIGDEINVQIEAPGGILEMNALLLEHSRGVQALNLARSNLDWLTFKEPIEGQEYIAIRIKLELPNYLDPDAVVTIDPYWHLTLRREEDSSDIWSVDAGAEWAEGYPPIEGTGWVFFLVRKETEYSLYFHPFLMITEQIGIRTGGAFFYLAGD